MKNKKETLEERVKRIHKKILREQTFVNDPKTKDFYTKLESLINDAESKGVNFNVITNILSNYPNVKFV